MKPKDDLYYIQKVLEGDTSAFSYLVGNYQDMIFSLCIQLLKDDAEASDTAQEVFIKVFRSLGTFKGSAKFSSWLYRIAYNHCMTKLRKKRPIQSTDDEGHLERMGGFESALPDKEDDEREIKQLQRCLKHLNEEDQFMLTLHYFDEKSVEDMAEIMTLSQSNVKVKLFRARKRLKDLIEKENAHYFNSMN